MGDSAPALEDGKRKKDMTLDQLPERSSFADAVSVQTNSLKKIDWFIYHMLHVWKVYQHLLHK